MPLSDYYESMEGWQPAKSPPTGVPSAPPLPDPTTQVNPYLRASLPLLLQYQPDTLRQFNRPGISSFRVAPLPPNALPTINAAAQGVATAVSTTIVNNAIAKIPAAVADVESIGINKQTGTSYTIQPSDLDTLVTFDNNSGGAITLPSPGGVATPGNHIGQVDGSTIANGFSSSVTLKLSPSAASDFVILAYTGGAVGSGGSAFGTPSGWTGRLGTGGNITFLSTQLTGPLPFSVSNTPGATQQWSACMTAFRSNGSATAADKGALSGSIANGNTLLTTSSVTAGNYLVYAIAGDGTENGALALTINDTMGNVWRQCSVSDIPYIGAGGANRRQQVQIWSALIKSTGTTTLTLGISAGSSTSIGGNSGLFELSGLATTGPVSGLPPNWFTYLENTGTGTFGVGSLSLIDEISQVVQLPPNTGMTVVFDGNNYYTVRGIKKTDFQFSDISGINPPSKGGTGSDMSNTGGPNQYVAQGLLGGSFTSQQPDYNDFAGIQKALKYNNQQLFANGLTTIVQTQDRGGSTGNVTPTNLVAIPASGGLVRISTYIAVQVPGSTSSTLPDTEILSTERDSSASITTSTTSSSTGNTTSTIVESTYLFNVKGNTIVQFAIGQVTPYASVGATAMQYTYRCRVEFLG